MGEERAETWVSVGSVRRFHAGPTCVGPKELHVGFDGAAAGAQLGYLYLLPISRGGGGGANPSWH